MADTLQTLSLITLAQEYRGDVVRQINRRSSLLKMLPIVQGEGKNLAWAPESSGQLTENFSEGADAANFGSDSQASAVLSWALYRANIHVSNLSMDAARTSSTPLGNRMLWARNIVNGSAALASLLNQKLFNGAGTGTTLAGLDVAIGDDANTYATIDRSTSAYWRPTVVDPGVPTAPTFALVRSDVKDIYEDCGENPDLAVCSPAVFIKMGSLFDNTRRQVDQVMTARGMIRLDFGFQALEVDGMMFVKDKDATANQIYYINSNHVEIQYLPYAEMEMISSMYAGVGGDDGFGVVPLGFKYEMLAKSGASEKAEIVSTLQLKVDRPNSCGVRKNVSTS